MIVPDLAFTHGGHFHADDVFSAALLQLCNPRVRIFRGFNVPDDFNGIVFDIGGGAFDHHGPNVAQRPNGVKYAAFGLLWKEFGHQFFAPEEAARFDEHFVQPIDIDDNTGCGNALSSVISAYNPGWDGELNSDACFARVQVLAKDMLWQKIKSTRSILRAKALVSKASSELEDGIVVLPQYAPWKMIVIPVKEAKFVVYPSQRGGFCAQCVPISFSSQTLRVPFPNEWAGLENEALREKSDIDDLLFCHAGRFLITAATKKAAMEACKFALRSV